MSFCGSNENLANQENSPEFTNGGNNPNYKKYQNLLAHTVHILTGHFNVFVQENQALF